ncbi:MAG TPA: ABC transporter permease, partial [Blastocatellia bacterium]|nr:ABC transporter permease [Blastocatellia bacterium]
FWVFFFPVVLALVLGIAFRNTAPEQTRVAVVTGASGDAAAVSRITGALTRSDSTGLWAEPLSPDEAALALRTGKVAVVISAVKTAEGTSGLEYRYDPTRPESRTARLAVDDALQREFGRADVVSVSEETTTEPGARYIDFLIPGLIGLNLMGSGMWGLGFSVVQARNRKLLKRLAATPMRRSHYLLSFMFSRLVILIVEVAVVVVSAWLIFDVKMQGSFVNFAVLSLVGAATFAGVGLLVAARPKTIEGVSGLMNLVMVPMWLFSGTFFSATRFPEFLLPFINALPLTALNSSLRAVMNEGASLESNWPQICIMIAWAAVSFVVALKVFRWQ